MKLNKDFTTRIFIFNASMGVSRNREKYFYYNITLLTITYYYYLYITTKFLFKTLWSNNC